MLPVKCGCSYFTLHPRLILAAALAIRLPPKGDIRPGQPNVRFAPIADIQIRHGLKTPSAENRPPVNALGSPSISLRGQIICFCAEPKFRGCVTVGAPIAANAILRRFALQQKVILAAAGIPKAWPIESV